MQQGFMFFGSLIGIQHFKWAANQTRAAGEMLSIFVCEKTDDGSLDAEPQTISVPSDHVEPVLAKLKTMKQFDSFGCYLTVIPGKNPREKPRLMFAKMLNLPGGK
ncbi:MAG: hypothetical protein EOM06_13930 [Sphingobacteriia bacterium]|nr:hypothetical protein [Sphingobacteriia bacterium]